MRYLTLLTLILGFTVALPAEQAAPSWMKPCQIADLEGEALCGKYQVDENRATKIGRKIELNVVIVRALSETPAPDPVFWLHGGPGAASTQALPQAKNGFLAGLRKSRDIVFIDQRGTGDSHPLKCDLGDDPSDLHTYYGPLFPAQLVRACREKLESNADLRLYTTPIAMDDLDEVRNALGYDRINLVAASYGTIAAQVFLRQHPEHIRSVFLLGVATPSVKQPLLFAKGAQYAIDLLFKDCEADTICHSTFPELKEEFTAVMSRFNQGDQKIKLVNLKTKEAETVNLTRANFVERIRLLLYTSTFTSFVPLIIHSAFKNDWLPFESITTTYNPGSILARGLYMTVTCSEGIPFISRENLIRETQGTFVGEDRVLAHEEACKLWPRGDVPESFIDPVKSSIPVLMISGQLDASTPPWWGESALKYLPNGRQVQIRYYGHQIDDPCVWNILDEFVHTASSKNIDATCTEQMKRPPFATEIPAQFSLSSK